MLVRNRGFSGCVDSVPVGASLVLLPKLKRTEARFEWNADTAGLVLAKFDGLGRTAELADVLTRIPYREPRTVTRILVLRAKELTVFSEHYFEDASDLWWTNTSWPATNEHLLCFLESSVVWWEFDQPVSVLVLHHLAIGTKCMSWICWCRFATSAVDRRLLVFL